MKTFTSTFAVLLAAALLASGCVNEEPAYKDEPGGGGTQTTQTEGYLAGISGLRVIADTDTDTQPDNTGDETQKPSPQAFRATRAGEDTIDASGYIVDILDADGVSQFEQPITYAQLQEMLAAEPLKLPVGTYRLEVRSEASEATPHMEWEHPVYGCSHTFSILKNETTTIDEVVCTLQNIKVTLVYSADLADQLSPETVTTISLGSVEAAFTQSETRAAYFMPQAEINTLELLLVGTFVDGGKARVQKRIENVKAGQWRKVTLAITYANEGNIKIGVQVDSFALDEEITVNGTGTLWEPVIDDFPQIDPTAPVLTWPGHDLAQPFELTDAMFDGSGTCTEPFALDIEAANGIESLLVEVSSTNAAFVESLTKVLQLTSPAFDLCALSAADPAYLILKGFGFPLGEQVRGQQHTTFDLAGQMPLLYNAPGFDGTHTFAFTITDAAGLTTEGSLVIVVDRAGQSGGPKIEWRDHDIDRRYPVETGMQIDIDITAPQGIRTFQVDIISQELEPALGELDIPSTFDLCNVAGDLSTPGSLAYVLHDMGFPVNDEVLGKTSFDPPFSITGFVDLLAGFSGDHDFRLTITDNAGKTTTKTIQLNVAAQ